MSSRKQIKINSQVEEYIKSFPNRKYHIVTQLHRYLVWRGITLKELIENGKSENEYLVKWKQESKGDKALYKNRITDVSKIKHFLREQLGIDLKRYDNKHKRIFYYDDHPVMKRFLMRMGQSQGAQKSANRSLSNYVDFRKMTLDEIDEEAKTIEDISLLKDAIIGFRNHLDKKIKTAYIQVTHVRAFYRRLYSLTIDFYQHERTKKKRKLMLTGKVIDKDLVQLLLNHGDIRDGCIILALWSSAANPIDLARLNVGHLENLNIDNPREIKDSEVIVWERSKTKAEFLLGFSKETLQYFSEWLRIRRDVHGITITNDTPILTTKTEPFGRINMNSFHYTLTSMCRKAGLEHMTSGDFRNNWNTSVAKSRMLTYFQKEMFLGHDVIDVHYDTTSLEEFNKVYDDVAKMVFNLEMDFEKFESLEGEVVTLRKQLLSFKEDYDPIIEDLIKRMNEQSDLILELRKGKFVYHKKEEEED